MFQILKFYNKYFLGDDELKFYDIKNFSCKNCNCKEYSVVSLEPVKIICEGCGEEITEEQYRLLEVKEVEI